MKNKKAMTGSIGIAIFVVLGMVAIAIAAALVTDTTNTTTITDDTFTASNTSCTAITSTTSNCILTLTSFTNNTGGQTIGSRNFTLCGGAGTYYRGVQLSSVDITANTDYNGKTINATYTQVNCNYVSNSFVQLLLSYIIVLLAVLVIMGVAKWTSEQ